MPRRERTPDSARSKQEQSTADETLVPWSLIPVSEPVLPGDAADRRRRENGWTIYNPALISVITGLSTSEAHRLLAAEKVRIDGRYALPSFDYIRPGDLVEVEGVGRYRMGPRESNH